MTDREQNIINRLHDVVREKVSNEFLVRLSELGLVYLNARTIPEYAKKHGMSYNGVKKCRQVVVINGVKFVIDNE